MFIIDIKMAEKEKELFYIRNEGYLGNAYMWWHKDRNGYTCDISNALKVDEKEAKKICQRPQDSAYKVEYIDSNTKAQQLIIDSQYVAHVEEHFKKL